MSVPTQGMMSNTATKITVYWNDVYGASYKTNRADQTLTHPCSVEFDPASVALLGEGAQCNFPIDSMLEIYLGYAATVRPKP
jgi:hypothetical protein